MYVLGRRGPQAGEAAEAKVKGQCRQGWGEGTMMGTRSGTWWGHVGPGVQVGVWSGHTDGATAHLLGTRVLRSLDGRPLGEFGGVIN